MAMETLTSGEQLSKGKSKPLRYKSNSKNKPELSRCKTMGKKKYDSFNFDRYMLEKEL